MSPILLEKLRAATFGSSCRTIQELRNSQQRTRNNFFGTIPLSNTDLTFDRQSNSFATTRDQEMTFIFLLTAISVSQCCSLGVEPAESLDRERIKYESRTRLQKLQA